MRTRFWKIENLLLVILFFSYALYKQQQQENISIEMYNRQVFKVGLTYYLHKYEGSFLINITVGKIHSAND